MAAWICLTIGFKYVVQDFAFIVIIAPIKSTGRLNQLNTLGKDWYEFNLLHDILFSIKNLNELEVKTKLWDLQLLWNLTGISSAIVNV